MYNFAITKNIYAMKSKKERLSTILQLVQENSLNNQEELLSLLLEKGFMTTQATLSRDIKELKIIKSPNKEGNYIYAISNSEKGADSSIKLTEQNELIARGFISIAFSDRLSVIKTRPGYAMGIASDIDNLVSHAILGTIAGDDTILLIPREEFSREQVIEALTILIPKSLLIIE